MRGARQLDLNIHAILIAGMSGAYLKVIFSVVALLAFTLLACFPYFKACTLYYLT
jgi:hypothetical protein